MNLASRAAGLVLLTLLWLSLKGDLSVAQAGLGLVVGSAVLAFSAPVLPSLPKLRRVLPLVSLAGVFVYDLVKANLAVARAALAPSLPIHPCLLHVPLDLREPVPASLLCSLVTLTPGTLSVDLDLGKGILTVHGLMVEDERAAIAAIKNRYEARIKEIWQC